ncbi:MAG: hypothetical protein OXI20_01340 [Rhodospirillales bacterium]|nr:hypothetical protein [Rhodospirillales bacterium]
MPDFDRRLPGRGLEALDRLASNRIGWWPDLLANWAPSGSSGGLRVAIRDGTLNFYEKGQSIARVTFGRDGNRPTMSIHQKYVKESNEDGQKYIKLMEAEGSDKDGRSVSWGGSTMLQEWIRRSSDYRGPEKRCIDSLVGCSPKVIDLEMGLPAFNERNTALRMDLVSLEVKSNDLYLTFWEAKMIGNSGLRSSIGKPEVFEQINAYRLYLADRDRRQRVAEAYINCCKIICKFHKMASRLGMPHSIDPLIKAAACADSMNVEEIPRLVVFDNCDPHREEVWQNHLKVLRSKVSVAIVDKQSQGMPIESIPRFGG